MSFSPCVARALLVAAAAGRSAPGAPGPYAAAAAARALLVLRTVRRTRALVAQSSLQHPGRAARTAQSRSTRIGGMPLKADASACPAGACRRRCTGRAAVGAPNTLATIGGGSIRPPTTCLRGRVLARTRGGRWPAFVVGAACAGRAHLPVELAQDLGVLGGVRPAPPIRGAVPRRLVAAHLGHAGEHAHHAPALVGVDEEGEAFVRL